MKTKEKVGISLIVLVITIIVIIILAGSVILSLSTNNPIGQAKEATFKTNVGEYNSELALAISKEYLLLPSFDQSTFDKDVWDGNGNGAGTIKEYITSITVADAKKFVIKDSKLVYVGSDQTEKNWLTQLGVENGIAPPSAIAINVIATANSTINGLVATYSNPIIPKGFKAINDTTIWPAGWNEGLVIQDTVGNQFVWIPVDGINVPYTKWAPSGDNISYAGDDTIPASVTSEISQINTYGGFYIARYEAGNASGTLISKTGSTVWNNINYTNAKSKSELMYNTSEVKSGLVTGTQYDAIMKWIDNLGDGALGWGMTWGNYFDGFTATGTLKSTGCVKKKNIYDLAGNVCEWTNETNILKRIQRGGSYNYTGIGTPVNTRVSELITVTANDLGFRISLYVL